MAQTLDDRLPVMLPVCVTLAVWEMLVVWRLEEERVEVADVVMEKVVVEEVLGLDEMDRVLQEDGVTEPQVECVGVMVGESLVE